MFNTNNKHHFLTYMLTRLSNFTLPSFNISMFNKEDGTCTTNNEDVNFAKIYSIL